MTIIGNSERKLLVSLIDTDEYDFFNKLARLMGDSEPVIINGIDRGVTYRDLCFPPFSGKRKLRKILAVQRELLNAKFGNERGSYETRNRLRNTLVKQMQGIITKLGERPFSNPMSLFEEHANNHGVVVSREFAESMNLENYFEVLPWPMFMGRYDKDYKQCLVGLKRSESGIIVVNTSLYELQ